MSAPTSSGEPAGRLRLARIPMELLLLLLEQPGQLVTREQIAERVWGKDVFLDIDNGINAVIRRIRQVLDDDPEQPRFIRDGCWPRISLYSHGRRGVTAARPPLGC